MVGKKKNTEIFKPGKAVVIPCACDFGKDMKKKCCKKYQKGKQCRRCPMR